MKRETLRPDSVGELIYRAADQGEISSAVAPLLIRSFLRGGLDTTTSTISAVIAHLAQNPDQYDELRRDPSKIRVALDEAMRLETPIQTACRLTTRDITFEDGLVVPENSKILVVMAAANRDPEVWDKPDCFDLGRNNSRHLALGSGIHMCVGQMIARMEGELVLNALIDKVTVIQATASVARNLNNNLRSYASVPIWLGTK